MLKFENTKPWRFRANNLSGVGLYAGSVGAMAGALVKIPHVRPLSFPV